MANGIMVDEATYYGDSEKYTGESGSSTNRWCVEDTFDFVAIGDGTLYPALDIGNGKYEIYFKLVSDIDFNEHPTYRFGFSNIRLFSRGYSGNKAEGYCYLDGDGHSICNILCTNYGVSGTEWIKATHISGVNFVNMILINCQVGNIELICAGISNCNFGVFMASSTTQRLFYSYSRTDCTFNIKGTVIDGLRLNTCPLIRTHINLDIVTPYNTVMHGTNNLYRFSLESSYITGRIKCTYTSNSQVTLLSSGILSNSYIALDIITENDVGISVGTFYVTYSTPNFIDVELMSNLDTATSYENLHYLTTEQAQDPAYLQSLGFVVVDVTS